MAQRIISFHYTLLNHLGETIDSSRQGEPFPFMEGARQIIPGLEKELVQLQAGAKSRIHVEAAEAYGPKNEKMIIKVPASKLPAQDIKVGDQFRGGPEQHAPVFTVIEVGQSDVTLDGNHPLAGQDLTFDVEIIEIREATADEIKHGHAHGLEGHEH